MDFIAKQQGYTEAYPLPDYVPDAGEGGGSSGVSDGESGAPVKYDVLFGEIARAAVTNGMISTSSIQRNYEVGFNRAGRIMLQLERAGIVGAAGRSQAPRNKVLRSALFGGQVAGFGSVLTLARRSGAATSRGRGARAA